MEVAIRRGKVCVIEMLKFEIWSPPEDGRVLVNLGGWVLVFLLVLSGDAKAKG
jgi:hypothetical protein